MAFSIPVRRSEMWLWRMVGLLAFIVCSLNVFVLWKGPHERVDRSSSIEVNSGGIYQGSMQGDKLNTSFIRKNEGKLESPSKQQLPPQQIVRGMKTKPSKDEIVTSVKSLPFLLPDVPGMMDPKNILILGKRREQKVFLTIGIPTVKRNKAFYLADTVRGVINGLSDEEKADVIIVIFIADFNENYKNHVKSVISKLFPSEVESGLIQIIVPTNAFYPQFRNLPLFFGDSIARVHWRSKQSLDYSFLYYYTAELGRYFLQLEDDVLTEKGFLPKIKQFINSRTKPWSTLEFGQRGFIGMMYNADNLLYLARYCRVNYFLMPVDWLFRVFNDIWLHGNPKDNVRKPPLFKHIGAFSSLDGQVRKLEDLSKNAAIQAVVKLFPNAQNPPAVLTTTIVDNVPNFPLQNAYSGKVFWGKTIKVDDTVTVTLDKPAVVERVTFVSGTMDYPEDSFEDTELFISYDCKTFRSTGVSKKSAIVDVKINDATPIQCVRLQIRSVKRDKDNNTRWLVIREIAIWVKK
eukprot:gene17783-19559_t